ncbi:translation elongation factor Ts [Chitinivibrio alkaliphilus]|uniref:Elongation factor Ts n=1 Tax=Chitinivibrio alkaliphilus ACht1 TaxID=1313304 RepID=U7D754_9BACT|nr:translation elongation factor Ts [Chitinivibrio alkaliphilus]ERP30917.1 translation elongation factor Ts [Chitinivibrio alkaliphilus ACht1]
MATITAAMVKELREKTGVGMMACKKALTEAEGNIDLAVDNLRKLGQAKAEKRADRSATEGSVSAVTDESCGIIFQLNCETDFVTNNKDFSGFIDTLQDLFIAQKPASLEDALNLKMESGTLKDSITDMVAKIGEKIDLGSYARMVAEEGEKIYSYVHNNGKVGALVKLKGAADVLESAETEKFGKGVCMHIAASAPLAVSRDDIPSEVAEKEKEIFREQIINEGKPEAIADKIVMGKMNKFFKERALLEQEYILADKQSVEAAAKEAGNLEITNFVLVELGAQA